jgi:hypothetical protein
MVPEKKNREETLNARIDKFQPKHFVFSISINNLHYRKKPLQPHGRAFWRQAATVAFVLSGSALTALMIQ